MTEDDDLIHVPLGVVVQLTGHNTVEIIPCGMAPNEALAILHNTVQSLLKHTQDESTIQ